VIEKDVRGDSFLWKKLTKKAIPERRVER